MVSRTGLAKGVDSAKPLWGLTAATDLRRRERLGVLGIVQMESVTDITVRQIGRTASQIMQKSFEVTAATDIGRDLGVDSLALMNIVMELEDVFELSIPLDRLADVETVGDLAALINELRVRA